MRHFCYSTGCFSCAVCTLEVDRKEPTYHCAMHAADEIRRAVVNGYDVYIVATKTKRKGR